MAFTGGEPTFHISIINRILKAHTKIEKCAVQITTNGWYAKSAEKIESTLDQFCKLDHLQLSYDQFHGSLLKSEDVRRLADYCQRHGIAMNVSICISDPMQLVFASMVSKETRVPGIFQKVDASGRAKPNNVAFRYPTFEPETLRKKCPNLGQISYICGRGFSVCCGNLMFNGVKPNMAHPTIASHMESKFFKQMKEKTFGELLDETGIDRESLLPEYSSPCRLCEHVHHHAR